MYLRILKKDLRRKKTMNIILLVFIILAAMFVSSSVNNILAIVNGVDSFFEKAGVADLLVLTIDYSDSSMEDTLEHIDEVEGYEIEPMIYINPDNLVHEGKTLDAMQGSGYFHPFGKTSLKFFDENNQVLTGVEPGTIWLPAKYLHSFGIEVGDALEITFGDVSKTLTVAGGFKDATVIGARFVVNQSDYDAFFDAAEFKGSLCYITTGDMDSVREALSEGNVNTVFIGDQDRLRTGYTMDMVVAGILLVVSVCLILVAFVVLKFTITFTLTEEYREIGVMKAIGIPNVRIRLLYMAKYCLIAVVGAVVGFFGSIPFSDMLLESVSRTMVLGSENSVLINVLCSASVVAVTLLFCFGCTGKVKKFTPVDAIRSGTTGERFHKKGLLHLSRSFMKPSAFMAVNDVLSSPRRFGAVILTFTLCLSLVLILVNSVNTLKDGGLITAFHMIENDVYFNGDNVLHGAGTLVSYFSEDGNDNLNAALEEIERVLAENGMEVKCSVEVLSALTLIHGEHTFKSSVFQGVRTKAEEYDYFEGSAPQNANEIAVTTLVAEELDAQIGDTITIRQLEGDREYMITALFQTMMSMGEGVRLHESVDLNYQQLTGVYAFQLDFADDPDEKELLNRIEKLKEIFDTDQVYTTGEYVESMVGVADTIDGVRSMVLAVVLIIIALITVLMEHSFITKERGEIAIMKAMGFSNGSIIRWHTLRFGIVALIAAVISLVTLMPLTELSVGPIFSYMGADFGIEYEIKPLEVYVIYPLIVLAVTMVSALLTSLHIRTVKASECSNID